MSLPDALALAAARVATAQLRSSGGRLRGLSAQELQAVEKLADGVAQAIVAELLDRAEWQQDLAAALGTLYGTRQAASRVVPSDASDPSTRLSRRNTPRRSQSALASAPRS
jgi:hypothetical protein